MQGDDLSVAIQFDHDTDSHPGFLVMPGHPKECTCGIESDINLIIAGGMSLRSVLDTAEKLVAAIKEQTIEDPLTGELYADIVR